MTSDRELALPVIDVGRFADDAWWPLMHEACLQWGCFQIINHGVAAEALAAASREFFAAPLQTKQSVQRSATNSWGFYDQELTKNVRDWKEIFDVGPASGSDTPQWPSQPASFRTAVQAFAAASELVARELLRALTANLGLSPDELCPQFDDVHTSFLRLNYYPVCDEPDKHLGISHHTDAGAITVLWQDAVPGLQFENEGRWCTAAPRADALTINLGDIAQVWSNDQYHAPVHRVLANSAHERYSAAFFYNPSYATNYAPLATTTRDQPARYRAINWGEFRAGRSAGDYADAGEEIQISQFRT